MFRLDTLTIGLWHPELLDLGQVCAALPEHLYRPGYETI